MSCALMLALMISTGCTADKTLEDQDADIYRKLHKKFSSMTSYTATVRLTAVSNQTENVYVLQQQVKDEQALAVIREPAALQGMATLYHGDRVSLRHGAGEKALTVPAADLLDGTFVHHFFSLYYQSEETAVSVSAAAGEEGDMLLETAAVPEQADRYKITMRLDSQKLEPKVITIYDVGGNIRMTAEFSDFCYNPKLSDDIFIMQEETEGT